MNPKVFTLGNRYRQDDGVGPWIARRLRQACLEHWPSTATYGECATGTDRLAPGGLEVCEVGDDLTRLLEGLAGAEEAWIVEAMRSGQPPGSLWVFEVGATLPTDLERLSSHALGLAETLELARTLGWLPRRTLIYAIEGKYFGFGEELSPEVMHTAQELIELFKQRLF